MAITLIASTSAGSSDGNSVTTGAIDTTGASLLVVAINSYALVNLPTLSDSKTNTWNQLTAWFTTGDGVMQVCLFYAVNPTVGSGHTFTASEDASFAAIGVMAFGGANTTSPFDAENQNEATGTSLQPGSVTPSEDGEVLVTALGVTSSATGHSINSSYILEEEIGYASGEHFGIEMAYIIQGSAAATNPTWSWSNSENKSAVIACFKAATGGGGTAVRRRGRMLMGVGMAA